MTVGLANNPGGGTLGGTLSMAAVNGVATFSGLTLDQAADGYTLVVTGDDLAPATTSAFSVTPAPATQLVFSGPSGNVLTGSPFSVAVNAEDPFGNVDPSFFGNVTLAIANNPSGATLGGTLTETAFSGVATFSDLTLSQPGSGFTLQATSTGFTAGTLSTFDVTNDQLTISTPPPGLIAANSGFELVALAQNGSGVTDTSFSGNVTVGLINFGSNSPTLGGTLTVSAVNGVVTFSGLTLNQPGSYALSVTGNGLAGTATDPFDVTTTATQLVATTQPPAAVTAGAAFGMAISAEDASGNVDIGFNDNVTLTLSNNPGSATLGGTLTMRAVNGVATFSDLTLDNTGSGYTLQATSSGLTQATTSAFNVTAPGTATQLVVTSLPPGSLAAGNGFGLIVAAENGSGNVDTSFNGAVTASLMNSAATLNGTLTVTALNGVASFSSLTVDQVGNYSLAATSAGVGAAVTSPFNVVPITTGPLNLSPDPVVQHRTLTLTAANPPGPGRRPRRRELLPRPQRERHPGAERAARRGHDRWPDGVYPECPCDMERRRPHVPRPGC